MKARLTGGLVAAALLGAGLVCPGAASAADPAGYPHDLSFEPTALVATDDAVYAAGVDEDGIGHVAEVGGDEATVGEDVWEVKIALDPSGDSLRVVTATGNGSHYWDVDTETMEASDEGGSEPGDGYVDALGADASGVYQVRSGTGSYVLDVPGLAPVELAENASQGVTASIGAADHRTWYVAGSQDDYTDPEAPVSTATLWTYDEESHEEGAPLTLGSPDGASQSVFDIAVDPTNGVAYLLTIRYEEDGSQTYGVAIVDGGVASYVALGDDTSPTRLALSPDGETLYITGGAGVSGFDTDELASYTEDTEVPGSQIGVDERVTALDVDPAGHVFAGADGIVVAFSDPSAPTALTATSYPEWPDEATVTWEAPTATGGVATDNLEYVVKVVDRAGEVLVDRDDYFLTDLDLRGLGAGHTYDISVATDNGLFVSAPVTTSLTVPTGPVVTPPVVTPPVVTPPVVTPPVVAPPAPPATPGTLKSAKPKVVGKAKVGKTLTAKAGSWTAGTKLAYEWLANGKQIKGADGSKLKLTKALKGKKISVAVTGTKSGYAKTTERSAQTAKVRR